MKTARDSKHSAATEPWYRQFWPWFLILLPGTVVVAAMVTIYIAVKNPQPLVKSDYYKDGLAINQYLADEKVATEAGLSARITLSPDDRVIHATLTSRQELPRPQQLELLFIHPTDDNLDTRLLLNRKEGESVYSGLNQEKNGEQLRGQRWYLQLKPAIAEDLAENWLLRGEFPANTDSTLLGAAVE